MIFSIIIPSFNQGKYIRKTLLNVFELRSRAAERNIRIEILLFDSESSEDVQRVLTEFDKQFDVIEIKKDKGQYDAINKGIVKLNGEYWTWLNTDDTIDIDGFFKLVEILKVKSDIDYIYGSINYMDENDKHLSTFPSLPLSIDTLVQKNPGIFQPGSFFRTAFTGKIGLLKDYRCCFDYEYVLRCLTNKAVIYQCDFPVACFRFYSDSKTGSIIPVFIREQLQISAEYGRNCFSFLTVISYLRLLKHKLFPRK
jgi:glycosyltransferase involved in cell wall biosynthesis